MTYTDEDFRRDANRVETFIAARCLCASQFDPDESGHEKECQVYCLKRIIADRNGWKARAEIADHDAKRNAAERDALKAEVDYQTTQRLNEARRNEELKAEVERLRQEHYETNTYHGFTRISDDELERIESDVLNQVAMDRAGHYQVVKEAAERLDEGLCAERQLVKELKAEVERLHGFLGHWDLQDAVWHIKPFIPDKHEASSKLDEWVVRTNLLEDRLAAAEAEVERLTEELDSAPSASLVLAQASLLSITEAELSELKAQLRGEAPR